MAGLSNSFLAYKLFTCVYILNYYCKRPNGCRQTDMQF